MHLKSVLLVWAAASGVAMAQPSSVDVAKIQDQHKRCSSAPDLALRAKCFEIVANNAIRALEQRQAGPQAAAPMAEAVVAPQPNPYGEFVAKAKANITASFKDPATAQWRGLYVSGKTMKVLCGEVNAKNSYGAYVGFRRFFATSESLLQEIETPANASVVRGMWPSMCEDKQADVE